MQDLQSATKHHDRCRPLSAVTVIAVGLVFVMSNLGVSIPLIDSSNGWAWLILLAAPGPLTRAYEVFRAAGNVDVEVAHSLLVAGTITFVAVMFLLDLDWRVWWPLFVILGGLFALVRKPYRYHGWPTGTQKQPPRRSAARHELDGNEKPSCHGMSRRVEKYPLTGSIERLAVSFGYPA